MAEAKVILVRQRLLLVGLGRGRTDLSYEPGRTVLPAYERYAEERSGHFFLRDQSTLQYYERCIYVLATPLPPHSYITQTTHMMFLSVQSSTN